MPFKSPIFHGKYCFALFLSLPSRPSGFVLLLQIVFHDPWLMCNLKKNSIFRLSPIAKSLQIQFVRCSTHRVVMHVRKKLVWRYIVFSQDVIDFDNCCRAPYRSTFRRGRSIVPIEGVQCTIYYRSLTSWEKTMYRRGGWDFPVWVQTQILSTKHAQEADRAILVFPHVHCVRCVVVICIAYRMNWIVDFSRSELAGKCYLFSIAHRSWIVEYYF